MGRLLFQLNTMPALPELRDLESIMEQGRGQLDVKVVCEVNVQGRPFPVYQLTLGNPDPNIPAIGFFGGVHGLERIGTQVLLHFLRGLLNRLQWDKSHIICCGMCGWSSCL